MARKKWNSPIYAFFNEGLVEYEAGKTFNVFKCQNKGCQGSVRRRVDTKDASSTGNMHKHVKKCWLAEAIEALENVRTAEEAREKIVKGILKNGTITAMFEVMGKKKITYSNIPHTRAESR